MGVVYAAKDERLGRMVALKALPSAFTSDPMRRARLTREARAAAALSHPSIATIFALEETDDVLCIVSELVRGRTLREELARRSAATAATDRHAHRHCGRTGSGARHEHRPPRSETGKRDPPQRRPDQSARLWPCPLGAAARCAIDDAVDRGGSRARHAGLHGARAAERRRSRRARGHLLLWRARVGARDGHAPVRHGSRRRPDSDGRPHGRAGSTARQCAGRARQRRPQVPARIAFGSLPLGHEPAGRPPRAARSAKRRHRAQSRLRHRRSGGGSSIKRHSRSSMPQRRSWRCSSVNRWARRTGDGSS